MILKTLILTWLTTEIDYYLPQAQRVLELDVGDPVWGESTRQEIVINYRLK